MLVVMDTIKEKYYSRFIYISKLDMYWLGIKNVLGFVF